MTYHKPRAVRALVLLSYCALLYSCALTDKLFHNPAAEQRATALLQLQLNVMRFADEYTGRISESLREFQNATTNANDRLAAQNWKVSQVTAAYTIATGPDPQVNAVDMVVFATLSRMVIDDTWVTARFGTRVADLRAAHAELEQSAWVATQRILTPEQLAELRRLIDEWRSKNRRVLAVAYIHFDAFAESLGRPAPGKPVTPGSLFSFLGLDPLSTLDPAVRELTQARQLAERALYFAERTPNLIDMQVERSTLQMTVMPETVKLLADINSATLAAQQAGTLAANLPDLLAQERTAAVNQLASLVDAREGQLKALLIELRSTLEAGTVTSDSLKATVASFDALMQRFDKPKDPASSGRPFDITE